jgi:hypothetical protein
MNEVATPHPLSENQERFTPPLNEALSLQATREKIAGVTPKLQKKEVADLDSRLTGNLYRVDGKVFLLNREGQVFELESESLVMDSKIVDQIIDQYEEELACAEANRQKARGLSKEDFAREEEQRIHNALSKLLAEFPR